MEIKTKRLLIRKAAADDWLSLADEQMGTEKD